MGGGELGLWTMGCLEVMSRSGKMGNSEEEYYYSLKEAISGVCGYL